MPKPVLERLRNYFQDIADIMAGEKAASSIFPNSSDAGMTRETIFKRFLENHLPKRCEVIKGGFIFDSIGNESNQIDVIVTNDLTLQFKQSEKSFNIVEGCYAAVSVKTMLDKHGLEDALTNLASIPQMPSDAPNMVNLYENYKKAVINLPISIVFAFEGVQLETTLINIETFYKGSNIPQNRRPKLIIVNNKYIIVRIEGEGGSTRGGDKLPPNTFYKMSGMKNIGSFALMYALTKVQAAANIGSHLQLDFDTYLEAISFE
jgi:hypothetical protein